MKFLVLVEHEVVKRGCIPNCPNATCTANCPILGCIENYKGNR